MDWRGGEKHKPVISNAEKNAWKIDLNVYHNTQLSYHKDRDVLEILKNY